MTEADGTDGGVPDAAGRGAGAADGPRVGVVVPAYNAAWSIGDTLRSVRSQTLRDFHCVVVDDGSTEDLSPAIAAATSGDARFAVVRQPNAGLAAARNRGLAEVHAPFVAFIDSDDLWHPDLLARAIDALRAAPAAPFAYAHSLRVDRETRLLPGPRWPHVPRHDLAGLVAVNSVMSGSASVFRTDAVRAAGGFDPGFRAAGAEGAEDWHLFLQLAAVAAPVLVPDALAVYRLNAAGMSQGDPARQMRAVRAVMADARARYPHLPAQAFRDARTTLNGWLLAATLRRLGWRRALRLMAESYLANPRWVLNRDLRAIHTMKLRAILRARGPRPHLSEHRDAAGRRPFAYLSPATPYATDAAATAVPSTASGR